MLDISEQTKPTDGIHATNLHRDRLLDTIKSIDKVIAVSRSFQSIMDVVAEESARLTCADGATIFLVENNHLSAKAASGILGFDMLESPIGNNSLPGNAVKLGHSICCADAKKDDKTVRRVSARAGARSSVSAPFSLGDKHEVAGVLYVASATTNAFTEADVEIIQTFADVAGSAIQNARQYNRVVRESREDPLTGLLNRRAFEEHARMLKKEQVNHARPYSLILFDMDRLKSINDDYGHSLGDEALKLVAASACKQVRKSDIVYRLGGDEFAVLLPQTSVKVAQVAAKRIERAIARKSIKELGLSVSTGTCESVPQESIPLLISRTDQLLYRAKHIRHLEPGYQNRSVAHTNVAHHI